MFSGTDFADFTVFLLFSPLCTAPPLESHLLSYHTALKFKAISDVSVPYGETTESTGLSCFMFHFNFSKDHAKPHMNFSSNNSSRYLFVTGRNRVESQLLDVKN
jgi:hypothetical protein